MLETRERLALTLMTPSCSTRSERRGAPPIAIAPNVTRCRTRKPCAKAVQAEARLSDRPAPRPWWASAEDRRAHLARSGTAAVFVWSWGRKPSCSGRQIAERRQQRKAPGGQPLILADRRQRLREQRHPSIEDVLQDRGGRPLVRVFRRDDDLPDATLFAFTPAGLTPPDAGQMHFSWPQRSPRSRPRRSTASNAQSEPGE